VVNLRERISISKRARQKFHLEKNYLRNLVDVEAEISNTRFAALENLDENLDINSTWENIKNSARENLGYHRQKHYKPKLDGECSKLIDRQKQAKLQWLQNPSQINGDNLQNLRRENSRTKR
jgi:hypothetical protein